MKQPATKPATAGKTVTNFERSDDYRARVHDAIPGGAHTYSKGDDQFPQLSPAAIARGKHGRVWDLDGNEFVDCSMALGSVNLGHAYEPVLEAVREQIELGVNFQRPAAIELEFAEEFLAAVPGADRVKFAKNGSTVTSAAVKLARAHTGRDLVAFPGNHAFYSYDDWFIGRTLCNSGVPEAVQSLSLTYHSQDPATLEKLFADHPGRIACIITEPVEVLHTPPAALIEICAIARRNGALVIIDEMVSGYRAGWPGAYPHLGLEPDMVTWGKAIGNGFAFCALTGRADVMDLGGIRQSGQPRVFLISTTHGGEAHSIAAARAVLREYQIRDVLGRQRQLVEAVAAGMRSAVADHGLESLVEIDASPWRIVTLYRNAERAMSPLLRTLVLQEMIGRGVLFQGVFLPCFTHTDEDVERIVSAFDATCGVYRHAIDHGVEGLLKGPTTRPVFRKYNGCEVTCPASPCPHEQQCRSR
jgi:glutamate-1-semialdehyde 2,1-aminomutase